MAVAVQLVVVVVVVAAVAHTMEVTEGSEAVVVADKMTVLEAAVDGEEVMALLVTVAVEAEPGLEELYLFSKMAPQLL